MANQMSEIPFQTESRGDTPNYKGYKWEMNVRDVVYKIPSIEYEGNPTNYYEWLYEHNKTSYDGIVTLPDGSKIRLEMKYRDVNIVYHSWFIKDWLPREADVYVTNNTDVISYKDKRALDSQHKKLMSLSEIMVYLGKIIRNILHPSKYLYLNSVFNDIIRLFIRLFVGLLAVFNYFLVRFCGFKAKFWHKSKETMFFKNKISEWICKTIFDHKSLENRLCKF